MNVHDSPPAASIADVEAAAARLGTHIRRTPLLSSPFLDDRKSTR